MLRDLISIEVLFCCNLVLWVTAGVSMRKIYHFLSFRILCAQGEKGERCCIDEEYDIPLFVIVVHCGR
jgi:hypothetical protein